MKRTILTSIALCLFLTTYAQQWTGASTSSGDIFHSGNVGLGTTTVESNKKLTVIGQTKMVNNSGRTLLLERENEDSWITFNDPNDYWFSLGIDRSNGGKFTINSGGNLGDATHFVMDNAGNVGIGTTSPDAKLTVKGSIHTNEVKVDLNVPGPDYVFEEDYKLPSLEEVAVFIKQNKHLPEIPSALKMEKEGINLSEMNILLLKKVEELTLYLIDLSKENKELVERIEVLENR